MGATAKDNRLFVEAVLDRYRAGIPWRDLPERFGDPIKIHKRFSRWAKGSAGKKDFDVLAADADSEYPMIDSKICARTSTAREPKKRRSRGGLSTKIHALDALGSPIAFFLTGGQAHDLEGGDELLPICTRIALSADKLSIPTYALSSHCLRRGSLHVLAAIHLAAAAILLN